MVQLEVQLGTLTVLRKKVHKTNGHYVSVHSPTDWKKWLSAHRLYKKKRRLSGKFKRFQAGALSKKRAHWLLTLASARP